MASVVQCKSINVNTFTPMAIPFGSPSTGGNVLVAFFGVSADTSPPTLPCFDVTDDASGGSNTWTPVANGQVFAGGSFTFQMYYSYLGNGGTGPTVACSNITATVNANGVAAGVSQANGNILELSGVLTSSDPLDVSTGSNSSGNTSYATGSITPTANGFAICGYGDTGNSASPPTVGSGWSAVTGGFDGANPNVLIESMATTSGTSFVGSGNGVGGFNYVCVASFKTAAVDPAIQSASAVASSPNAVAFGSSNTAGNTIVATVEAAGAATTGISDSNGNVYTLATIHADVSNSRYTYIYVALGIASGANTVTWTGGGSSTLTIVEEPAALSYSAAVNSGTGSVPAVTLPGTQGVATSTEIVVFLLDGNGTNQAAGTIGTNAAFVQANVNADRSTQDGYSPGGQVACTGTASASAAWSALGVILHAYQFPPTTPAAKPGLAYADLVRQTTTTTGTGTVTLTGYVTGYASLASAIADGQTIYYLITGGSAWESGRGVYSAAAQTLSRDVVFASSSSGALVSFAAGAKDVWIDQPLAAIADRGQTIALRDRCLAPQ